MPTRTLLQYSRGGRASSPELEWRQRAESQRCLITEPAEIADGLDVEMEKPRNTSTVFDRSNRKSEDTIL